MSLTPIEDTPPIQQPSFRFRQDTIDTALLIMHLGGTQNMHIQCETEQNESKLWQQNF